MDTQLTSKDFCEKILQNVKLPDLWMEFGFVYSRLPLNISVYVCYTFLVHRHKETYMHSYFLQYSKRIYSEVQHVKRNWSTSRILLLLFIFFNLNKQIFKIFCITPGTVGYTADIKAGFII